MPESDSKRISLSDYWRLLSTNRNFRCLWMAQIVSEIGDWLYSLAIFSLLLELTGQAKSVSLAFVLQVLPQVFVSPLAGVINDRLSRKQVMIFADCARAVVVACMLLAQSPGMVWLIYILLLLESVFWALFEPARGAVIPNISSGEELFVANSLSSTTWSINFALGFSIGGLLAALFGRETVFALNALSFVGSALLIRRMRFQEPHTKDRPPMRAADLADFSPVVEGIRYVSRDKRLLATLFVKAGLGFMGANWVILPIMGERSFPVHLGWREKSAGMIGMSILMGFRGVGAILGPIIGGYLAGRAERRLRIGIVFGFLAAGAGYILLGEAGALAAACACVALAHAGGSVIWVFSTTLLQVQTEDRFRGRVFSAEFALCTLTMAAMSALAGVMLDRGVAVTTLASFTGIAILLPCAAWMAALRLWRKTPERVYQTTD